MKKWDKEVQQSLLKDEQAVIRNLEKCYQSALKDVDKKIGDYTARITAGDNVQSAIYQKKYQEELKKQVEQAINNLQQNNYNAISDYLNNTYKNSFIGVQYSLHNQGVPLILHINQEQVVRAVTLNSKISQSLYNKLGVDVNTLKNIITNEVSRGISTGSTWTHIAKQISNKGNVTYSNAVRIARTEGHRIQNEATLDAVAQAKKKGADVVKQWDSTLDDKTRDTHRQLDGQIREIDEYFEVNGLKATAPGLFGDPAEDCNCRCCLLQRARWGLDSYELKTLEERAEYFGLDKTKDFEDFKEKYLNSVANSEESGIIREESKKPITVITDKAIERVPKVNISGYSEDQCTEIQRQHKELLEYSRSHNNNNEVAFVFRKDLTDREVFTGTDDKLNFGNNLIGKGDNIVVMHNHPRNSSFSTTDIDFFAVTSNVKTLTIVKNNGKVEILTKCENFDISTFAKEYSRLYKKIVKTGIDSEKDKFVKTLLTKSKAGVIWNEN